LTPSIVTSIDQACLLFDKIDRKRDFFLCKTYILALVLTQPQFQWEPGIPSTGVKWQVMKLTIELGSKCGTNACRILVGMPEGKSSFGRPSHRWRVILKWILKK
jgi:hypothetical protein